MRRSALSFLLLGLIAVAMEPERTTAEDRTTVAVKFVLQAYATEFSETETPALEADAAASIARVLQQRIGFTVFRPVSASTDKGPLLTFRLAAKDAQASRPAGEVGFHIELSGLQTGSRAKRLYWTFRQDPFGQRLGDKPVPALLREIELRIGGQDYTALIRDVLSQVPIAHTGRLWMDPLGWVLPHRSVDLCMDRDSLLRIEAAVPSGVGPMVHPFHARAATHFDPPGPTDIESYRGCLFGKDTKEAITQEVGLGNLARTQPNTVQVKGIYVEEYLSLAPCGTGTSADSLAPDNQDFRRPGGGS